MSAFASRQRVLPQKSIEGQMSYYRRIELTRYILGLRLTVNQMMVFVFVARQRLLLQRSAEGQIGNYYLIGLRIGS